MTITHFLEELGETAAGEAESVADDTHDEAAPTDPKDSDPAAGSTAESSPRRRKSLSRPVIGGLAALVVTLAAACGYLGWQNKAERDVAAAAAGAQQAATAYAVTLTSVDSNDLDANFAAVLDGATGEFRDIYSASSTKLRQLLIEHRATGHGVVIDSAVKSAGRDEAVVLLFVDQTISNTEVPDPRIDHSRMLMTMQRTPDGWKASKVELP